MAELILGFLSTAAVLMFKGLVILFCAGTLVLIINLVINLVTRVDRVWKENKRIQIRLTGVVCRDGG